MRRQRGQGGRQWRACLVEPLSPAVVEHASVPQSDAEPEPEPLLLAKHKPLSLWVVAAFEGFPALTSAGLSELISEKDVMPGIAQDANPRLMLHKVLVCVQWALPGITKEKLAEIMRLRAGIAGGNRRPSLLLDGNCLDSCGGGQVRDDVKTAKEYKAGTFDPKRVLEVSMVTWLREEGLITDEEEKAIE